MTVKTQGGKVITKEGKVSCECCEEESCGCQLAKAKNPTDDPDFLKKLRGEDPNSFTQVLINYSYLIQRDDTQFGGSGSVTTEWITPTGSCASDFGLDVLKVIRNPSSGTNSGCFGVRILGETEEEIILLRLRLFENNCIQASVREEFQTISSLSVTSVSEDEICNPTNLYNLTIQNRLYDNFIDNPEFSSFTITEAYLNIHFS
jgi:hypothetical protein